MQTDEKPGKYIHSKYRWADTALVPRHDSVGWAILKGTRRIHCDDANQVLTKLKGWSPLHGLLVGMPGSSCFVPPICVPRLRGRIKISLYRSQWLSFWLMVVFATLSICVAAVFFTRASVVFAVIFVLAALMHWIDYRLLKNERAIHDRSCFYYFLWHGHAGKSGLRFWLLLGIGMGIGQIVLQHGLGGLDPLVIKYGIYYPAVIDEWWRFLIGPFFHSGLPHYFANLSALLFIGPIVWLAIGPLPSILTFLFGSMAGAVAAFVINNSNNDSYLGVSGGVFALFGLVVILGLTSSRALPRNLAIQYAWLTAIFAIGAEVFINTSTVGHFIGFSTGAVSAIALYRLVLPVGKRYAQ